MIGRNIRWSMFFKASASGDFVSNSSPLANIPLNTFQVLVLFLPR